MDFDDPLPEIIKGERMQQHYKDLFKQFAISDYVTGEVPPTHTKITQHNIPPIAKYHNKIAQERITYPEFYF